MAKRHGKRKSPATARQAKVPPREGAWWADRRDPKKKSRLWNFPREAEEDLLAAAGFPAGDPSDEAARLIEDVERLLRGESGARCVMDGREPPSVCVRQAERVLRAVDELEAALAEAGMLESHVLKAELVRVYATARDKRGVANQEPARHRPTQFALRHFCVHLARIFNVYHRPNGRAERKLFQARRDFVAHALEAAGVNVNGDALAKLLRPIPLNWRG